MTTSFKTSDFNYELPENLIAKYPLANRTDSRLLLLNRETNTVNHAQFKQFVDFINENDLLVFNNTKVIPARLFGHKKTGGKVAALVERILSPDTVLAHLKSSKSPTSGSELVFADKLTVTVLERQGDLFILKFHEETPVTDLLEKHGHLPLPPYLERDAETLDWSRYQTVFAKHRGAVAAPTAALHFDEAMLKNIEKKGIKTAFVTLHVGAGTFQPVRTEHLNQHHMHQEYLEVSEDVCQAVNDCRSRGGRVIAVGTTVVRCLETASKHGRIAPYQGDTQLFIYPGYSFRCIDGLLTNFHLPKSTLLMLICAFAGYEFTLSAYKTAVEHHYRFFSYGDAMLVI